MKKVLFIGHDATRSGAPFVLLHLLRWIRENRSDVEFELLLLTGGDLLSEYEKICRVHILRADIPETGGKALVRKGVRALRKILGAEGCLVAQLAQKYSLILGNTAVTLEILNEFKKKGARTICWMHEMDFALDRFFDRETFAELARNTDRFIVGSGAVFETLVRRGVSQPIEVVHDFIDSTHIPPSLKSDIRAELSIPAAAFLVGSCASIEFRKGVDLFVQIAKHTIALRPDVYFIWIGGNSGQPNSAFSEAQFDLEKAGLADRVHFVTPARNLFEYYRALDVFLLPSREDTFPLVCLEAASVGKPILCFNGAGGMPEFVEEDAGFSVPYLDVFAMTQKVVELASDRELLTRLGEAAALKVRKRHDVSKAAVKILSALESLAPAQ
jgi:glycosyltransferase involved in cell wall biosynthesis